MQLENNSKTEEKYYFNKKVCVINKLAWMFCKSDDILIKILFKKKVCAINKLAWMFCKSDGINCYCYQRDGELCQGKVMGWGWAFQWDPPYVTLV